MSIFNGILANDCYFIFALFKAQKKRGIEILRFLAAEKQT